MKKRSILLIGLLIFVMMTFSCAKYNNMNINDIGLKALGWVKKIKGEAVETDKIVMENAPKINHKDWDNLVQQYVSTSGKVNYKGFIKDSVLLQNYLNDLSQHPPGNNWTENEALAYWINAYNAFTVKLIVDNYPLKSIKDISNGLPMFSSPWDIKFFKIGGVDFDLNTIEHEILRKMYNEPRIHFAINCASISCPKLRNEAFTAGSLDSQLDNQTKDFLGDPEKNKIASNETELSKIFDWFKSDFTKHQSLIEFLQPYTNISITKNTNIKYMNYNWDLNE